MAHDCIGCLQIHATIFRDHDPNRAVAYVYMIAMCKQWNSVLFTDGTQIVSHYTWMVMVWSLQQCNKQTHEQSYHTKSCLCIQCLWTEAGSSLWNINRNSISRTTINEITSYDWRCDWHLLYKPCSKVSKVAKVRHPRCSLPSLVAGKILVQCSGVFDYVNNNDKYAITSHTMCQQYVQSNQVAYNVCGSPPASHISQEFRGHPTKHQSLHATHPHQQWPMAVCGSWSPFMNKNCYVGVLRCTSIAFLRCGTVKCGWYGTTMCVAVRWATGIHVAT